MAGVFAMNDDEMNSLSGRLYDVSWALDELDMPANPGSGPMGSLGLSNSLDTFISEGDRRIDTWSSWASNTADAVGMASRQSQRTDDSWSRLSLSHQDSCQESCQRVMMTRAAAMIVVMAAGPGETRCRALKCLNMALALSAGARRADSRLLQASSSGVGQGFFVGVITPIPAPW